MNAPDPITLIERLAIPDALYLPLTLCKPAGLNHRKRFSAAAMAELVESVSKVGVMQPVIARRIAGAKRGGPLYEVLVGERRLRASNIVAEKRNELHLATIPAILRDLSDFEARELATVENLQREDVHPLEEAEGYEDLLLRPIAGGEFKPPRVQGYTVEQLAARIGKSTGYVFKRLKLLALIPAAREAFYDDKVSNSVAVLIARMPASVQPEATKKVLQGWGGDPLPFRQARELLEREFMLKLSSAPFKITDETLVPGAGNCKECPKRTGANPDLFDDIKSGDVCTDPACFAAKKDAHHARIVEQAKAEGREVITGAAAKKVLPGGKHGPMNGFLRVDEIDYRLSVNKPLDKLLGKDSPPVTLLEDPHTHDLIRVVATDAAMAVLKEKGFVKGTSRVEGSSAEKQAEKKAKAEVAWRTELARRVVAECVDDKYDDADMHTWLLPEIAKAMWARLDNDTSKHAAQLLGWTDIEIRAQRGPFQHLNAKQLDQALIAMAIAGQLHVNQYTAGAANKPERLLQIAGRLGIDGAKVRAELDAAAKAKVKPKPAAKKKAPSVSLGALMREGEKLAKQVAETKAAEQPVGGLAANGKVADPVGLKKAVKAKAAAVTAKYRNTATGETWSGRGLQPKWLKVALAGGKTLADFAVDAPPAAIAAAKPTKPAAMLSDRAAWPFPDAIPVAP